MKNTLIIIFTICAIQISCSQDKIEKEKSKNHQLIKILNNVELIGEHTANYIAVKIYKIHNGTGSAGFPNSEVSHNLLIAVSEFDEEPNQALFKIGPFYNPKLINWNDKDKYEKGVLLESGNFNNRKTLTLKININELKIVR